MEKLRVGQIGLGHNHGEGKMLSVRKRPDLFEVVGYAEEKEDWVEKRGGLPCYAGLPRMTEEELIASCDALLIETDVQNLTRTATRCVLAGKPVHMDKPASGTLQEYGEMLRVAKRKNLAVQLGYMYRYNDALCKCKQLAKNGDLGEIYQIDAEMSLFHSPEYRKWLADFPGGTMYIFGSHLIDLVTDLLGEPKRVVPFLKSTGYADVSSRDNCFAVLEYENALARVTSLSVEVGGFGMRRFAVMGSRGTVEIKPLEGGTRMTLCLAQKDGGKPQDVEVADLFDGCRYDRMMEEFYDIVTGRAQAPYSYDYEWMLQKTLLRATGEIL